MAVPKEIRAVPRPKNTVVEDSGHNGPKRYAVRERKTEKYIPGGNPQPRNGKVIGHIINMKYVPVITEDSEKSTEPDMLSYGTSALFHSVTQDIEADLLTIFEPADVFTMLSVAALRVIKPHISVNRMSSQYNRCFISQYYPGAAISKNSVGNLFEKIGKSSQKRKLFFERRMKATAETHHIAIDGTLKQDTSKINDLSAYSHKARVRGCGDISVIYAYDIEKILIDAVAAGKLWILLAQISGKTYTLKLHVECPLDDRFIGESSQDICGYTVAVRQISSFSRARS